MIKKTTETEKLPAGMIALELLIDKFRNGDFKPGQPIRESLLAEEFGLSRNAVREALNQIVGWDICEYVPYCGYRIRDFTLYDLFEWREMREAIEPIAARRLARLRPPEVLEQLDGILTRIENTALEEAGSMRQLDFEFHMAMVDNCGQRRFRHLQTVGYLIANFFYRQFEAPGPDGGSADYSSWLLLDEHTREEHQALINARHREIFDHIAAGREAEAERSVREHAADQVRGIQRIINHLQELGAGNLVRS